MNKMFTRNKNKMNFIYFLYMKLNRKVGTLGVLCTTQIMEHVYSMYMCVYKI